MNQMSFLNSSTFPILHTERLLLRQLDLSDHNEIFHLRSNENVNRFIDRKPCHSIEEAKDFIHAIQHNFEKKISIYWAITVVGSENLIGTICLYNFSVNNLKAEIGFELHPDHQGKGIMHEAASQVIKFGMKQIELKEIEALTHPEIKSSQRLLQRLHFNIIGSQENCIKFLLTSTRKNEDTP